MTAKSLAYHSGLLFWGSSLIWMTSGSVAYGWWFLVVATPLVWWGVNET